MQELIEKLGALSKNKLIANSLVVITASMALSGCFAAAVTGAGVAGYTVAQERSVGDAVDDTAIATRLTAIYWDKKLSGLFDSIDVDVTEGRVLLTGKVRKPEDRVEAVRLAWTVEGVKEVISELQVADKSSVKSYAYDVGITAQVKAKMLLNKEIRSINYSIDTVDSVVYLMGIAQDRAELERAKRVVNSVSGVKKVVSHVVVKSNKHKGTSSNSGHMDSEQIDSAPVDSGQTESEQIYAPGQIE